MTKKISPWLLQVSLRIMQHGACNGRKSTQYSFFRVHFLTEMKITVMKNSIKIILRAGAPANILTDDWRDKLQRVQTRFTRVFPSLIFNLTNYLTRAGYSPTSDPGKAVLPACLPPGWLPGYFVRVCREDLSSWWWGNCPLCTPLQYKMDMLCTLLPGKSSVKREY